MGGSTQKSTSTQSSSRFGGSYSASEPWDVAQKPLVGVLGESKDVYDGYQGRQTHLNDINQYGRWLSDSASNRNNIMADEAMRIGQEGGTNAVMDSAIQGFQQPTYTSQNLMGYAQGDMLDGNPHLDAAIANSARDIRESLNENASAAGRYGSGAYTRILSRNIGDMSLNARLNEFARQEGNMFNANQMIDGAERARMGSLFNAGQTQLQNRLGAYGLSSQLGDSAIGGQYAALDMAQAEQAAAQNRLNQYASIVSGIAGQGGSNFGLSTEFSEGETTTKSPGQSPLQQIIGGAKVAQGFGLFGG